jgi:hypothetical protein
LPQAEVTVNFTVVAFTVAGNSSSLFGESGSPRLIINYNTKCKNILNDYLTEVGGRSTSQSA